MVILTNEEKNAYIDILTDHLPALRKCIGLSQEEFGDRAGVSRRRISLIETRNFKMTWSQFTSFCFVLTLNKASKDYLHQHKLFGSRLYQFLQCKDESVLPDLYIPLSSAVVESFFSKDILAEIADKYGD